MLPSLPLSRSSVLTRRCNTRNPASTSNNGITGTWAPAVISTAAAGTITYTFTPDVGQCGTVATMDIVVNTSVTSTFTQLGPYCVGATPGTLPLTSNNGITGTWAPAVISTAAAGTITYTFTPDWVSAVRQPQWISWLTLPSLRLSHSSVLTASVRHRYPASDFKQRHYRYMGPGSDFNRCCRYNNLYIHSRRGSVRYGSHNGYRG